jgi:hypothetical protein
MPATRALVEHKPPLLQTLNPQSRTDHTETVVQRADRTRDVGSVTVVVAPVLFVPAVEVPPAGDVEIRVVGIDAGVEDRDVEQHLKPRLIPKGGKREICFSAIDSGWQVLNIDRVYFIELDRGDSRVIAQSVQACGGYLGGETKQRGAIRVLGDESKLSRDIPSSSVFRRTLGRREPPIEDDDHVGRSRQRELGLGWRSRSTGFAARRDRDCDQQNEEKTSHGAPQWKAMRWIEDNDLNAIRGHVPAKERIRHDWTGLFATKWLALKPLPSSLYKKRETRGTLDDSAQERRDHRARRSRQDDPGRPHAAASGRFWRA